MITSHLIKREYQNEINQDLIFTKQLIQLAKNFRSRLSLLVTNWLRVGFCQGNFNSDNCSAGGYTLDYGPFGFCEQFDENFQPWISGGKHFSYFNQPIAAEANFHMFWKGLRPLLANDLEAVREFDKIHDEFELVMKEKIQKMWASKLGLKKYDEILFEELVKLMRLTNVDFTIFFRELSYIPDDLSNLKKSFYHKISKGLEDRWNLWLKDWKERIDKVGNLHKISEKMKSINPKYTWREWLIADAYNQADNGNYLLIKEVQDVLNYPYDEQTKDIEDKYYRLRPKQFHRYGGISHYSCSS